MVTWIPRLFGRSMQAGGASANGRYVVGNAYGFGGFRWSEESGTELLPGFPGNNSGAQAYAVADDGLTIGTSGGTAALWDQDGVIHELREWLRQRGVDVRRYYFTYALAISANGRVIVTLGLGDSGEEYFVIRLDGSACPGDLGRAGGLPEPDCQLDNNDFIAFIDLFFSQSPLADRGGEGGLPGADGDFDNNDFAVFVDQFFTGCP